MKKATTLSTSQEAGLGFDTFGLSADLIQKLTQEGISRPTEIQQKAIPSLLSGRDLIGISPTASGKTLAFTLPILHSLLSSSFTTHQAVPLAVVITPTRELAQQIHLQWTHWIHSFKLKSLCLHGGGELEEQLKTLRQGADLIVATPGRLLQVLKKRPGDFRFINHIVLDEADKILDMGLMHELKKILQILPKASQKSFFSATWGKELQELSFKLLRQPVQFHCRSQDNPSPTREAKKESRVKQYFYDIPSEMRADFLSYWLKTQKYKSVIIFVEQKSTANQLYDFLCSVGIACQRIHSDRSSKQRENAMTEFLSGKNSVLIATDLVARGIHHEEVTHVLHYDLALNPEDHVHRVGRAGRSEKIEGQSLLLASPQRKKAIQGLLKKLNLSLQEIKFPNFKAPRHPSPSWAQVESSAKPKTAKKPASKEMHIRRGEGGFLPP